MVSKCTKQLQAMLDEKYEKQRDNLARERGEDVAAQLQQIKRKISNTSNKTLLESKRVNELECIWNSEGSEYEGLFSFWEPKLRKGWVMFGHYCQNSSEMPENEVISIAKEHPAFLHPTNFKLVWKNERDNLYVWLPVNFQYYVNVKEAKMTFF